MEEATKTNNKQGIQMGRHQLWHHRLRRIESEEVTWYVNTTTRQENVY